MEGHFAWPNVDVLCGECGFMMYPESRYRPGESFDRIVRCPNKDCTHFGILYRVPKSAAFQLEKVEA
jgi:hypothetical protein